MQVLELEGLKFKAVAGGVTLNGPATRQPAYSLSWAGVTALIDWLAVEFNRSKSCPTIADLINEGYLPPLAGDKVWQRIMNSADLSPEVLTAAVWNGEGLPPVGCECEYMWNYRKEGSEYVPVKVLAHDESLVIVRVAGGKSKGELRESLGGNCGPGKGQPIFRPLRTAEQLAAEAREKAIDEMAEATEVGFPSRILLGDLYDAGYRKSDA